MQPDIYNGETPQKSDMCYRPAGEQQRHWDRHHGPSAYPASDSSAASSGAMSFSRRSKSAAPHVDLHMSSARAELAIACAQFKETAVEVRRREKRLRQLEHLSSTQEDDDLNAFLQATSPNASSSASSKNTCGGIPPGVVCVVAAQPSPSAASAAHVAGDAGLVMRRPSNRASDEDLSEYSRRERRLKKELRIEKRMRRRAEDSVASMWWNTLLVVVAVALCVIGVVSLSVAFSRPSIR